MAGLQCAQTSPSLLVLPVTALRFIDNLLLAGQGPVLKIFDIPSKTLLKCYTLFEASSIHGIKIGPRTRDGVHLIAVHGGKSCCVLTIDTTSPEVIVKKCASFEDWILTCLWLTEENSLALITAHNCVLRWDWNQSLVTERVHCEEKCILYSALLIGDRWADLVVAAGTVFNQVVIWAVCGEQREDGRRVVIHRLVGHEGVIFSIAFSPKHQTLCSVSDDRSIRVWSAHDSTAKVCAGHSAASTGNQTGTDCSGMSELLPSAASWQMVTFTLRHVLYGHTARVWDICYLGDKLVSIGEDSTCCVWSSEGRVVKKFKGHTGKSIWSLAVDESKELAATGGGDCGIRLWAITDTLNAESTKLHDQHQANTTLLLPPLELEGHETKGIPKVTRLINGTTVLVMTDSGALYKYDAISRMWSLMNLDSAYRSYSVMSVSPCGESVAIGNIFGQVKLFDKDGEVVCQCYEGKVFSLSWLNSEELLTTGPDGHLCMWQLSNSEAGRVLELLASFTLPPAKQRWVSASEKIPEKQMLICGDRMGSIHVYDTSQQAALAGPVQSLWKLHGKAGVTDIIYHNHQVHSVGRDGQYRQYDIVNGQLHLLHTNKVLKGLEWISQLWFLNGDLCVLGFYTDQFIVYSIDTNQQLLSIPCGGGHRSWDMVVNNHKARFVFIKSGQVEMVEAPLSLAHSVLQPSLHGREITDIKLVSSVPHRQGTRSVVATCSEDTTIQIVELLSDPAPVTYRILTTIKGHISSVRSMAVSQSRTSRCSPKTHQPQCPPPGLPSSSVNQDGGSQQHQVLLFSGGGRAELKCWRLQVNTPVVSTASPLTAGVKQSCQTHPEGGGGGASNASAEAEVLPSEGHGEKSSICYEHLATHTLHEKTCRNRKPWKRATLDADPETRFMSLSACPVNVSVAGEDVRFHLVAAACSDGFVRLLVFDEWEASFHLLAQSDYHSRCVLNIEFLTAPNQEKSCVIFLCSAGTDERLVFWRLTDIVQRFTRSHAVGGTEHLEVDKGSDEPGLVDVNFDLRSAVALTMNVHQSGVTALQIFTVQDGKEYLVVTGGDDNKLTAHRLVLSGDAAQPVLKVVASGMTETAHAAQINGVHIIDATRFLSVSIDQRLTTWTISPNMQLSQETSRFVHVADVSRMACWTSQENLHAVVSGMGLEYLTFLPDHAHHKEDSIKTNCFL